MYVSDIYSAHQKNHQKLFRLGNSLPVPGLPFVFSPPTSESIDTSDGGLIFWVLILVVKLIHLDSNSRFNIGVALIILSVGDERLLMTDFVNLRIKSAQSFRYAPMNRVCVYIHKNEYSYIYKYLRL
jgi:hypothetical protein